MLGALVCFLCFLMASYWWALSKQFRSFRKGLGQMTILHFVLYALLSCVVLGFLLFGILSVTELDYVIVYILTLVTIISFIAFQSYRYFKTVKKQKEPTSVEDVELK